MMIKRIFYTNNNINSLILRLMLGIVFFPHGAQKLLGWFGGQGFSATMNFFTSKMHIPAVLSFLIIITESLGSLCLIIGILTRLTAFSVLCIMTGAIWLVHWPNGFFMNWFGNQAGEGFEYHLLVIAMSFVLIIAGAGKWSVDRWLTIKLKD
jgi:putative oxidoreductase